MRGSVSLTVIVSILPLASLLFLGREAAGTDWSSLLTDETWRDSLLVTLYVVSVSTFTSLVLGTWLARSVSRSGSHILARLARLPMFVPHVAAAYLFLLLFADGIIAPNERHHLTVILTYVWKEVPFVFLMMLGTYEQMNRGYVEMAKTLKLSPFGQFRHAELPFLVKPLLDTFWILVAFISFAYEVPALLGVTYPKLLGVLAFERLSTGLYLEASEPYAVAFIWTLTVATGVFLSYVSTYRLRRRIERGVRR